MNQSKQSKKSKGTRKPKPKPKTGLSEKEFMKAFEQHKKKVSNFKYNVRNDKTMKKCHNFCKTDYLVEQYKNLPANLKPFMNKTKFEEMDLRLCKKDFCNERCAEGFDFEFAFGDKEKHKKEFQNNFRKKLYNGFVDSYSPAEVEMFKKKGALSGCVKPIHHKGLVKPSQGYNVFHK
jgi:hypothetical protein